MNQNSNDNTVTKDQVDSAVCTLSEILGNQVSKMVARNTIANFGIGGCLIRDDQAGAIVPLSCLATMAGCATAAMEIYQWDIGPEGTREAAEGRREPDPDIGAMVCLMAMHWTILGPRATSEGLVSLALDSFRKIFGRGPDRWTKAVTIPWLAKNEAELPKPN